MRYVDCMVWGCNLNPMLQRKIWILVGTRPEVIKQVPLYLACVKAFGKTNVALIGTGQHRELLDQALRNFSVELDHNMQIMQPNQTLSASSAAVLTGMDELLKKYQPEWIVVQGDTTTAAMAAWASFQHGVRVAHNEAGLRSYDLQNPFPEEANRKLVSIVADAHFAPTELAKAALLKEGVPADRIAVTGNTGIDALRMTLEMPVPENIKKITEQMSLRKLKPVLLTAHRRENRGDSMDKWFQALRTFIDGHPDLYLVYPMHPNNAGALAAQKHLASSDRVLLTSPFDYRATCHLLQTCRFVVTDSGGIQEEASTLGMPVVVCRKTTERMEAVHVGAARLAGTEVSDVLEAMQWAYAESAKAPESQWRNIFGDGYSADRIAAFINRPV